MNKFIKYNLLIALSAVIGLFWFGHAQASLLYTSAANQAVYEGQTFIVEWYLDTQDEVINSLALTLTFSTDTLEVVDVTPADSGLDLWIKSPVVDNTKGTIELIGGVSGGVKNSKVPLFRAVMKPKQVGKAKISMDQSSAALKSDGQGTPANLVFNEINFSVNPASAKPALISSPSHTDQDVWYLDHNVIIQVTPKDQEQYSFSFSSNTELLPDDQVDDLSKPLTFKDLPDGIYYFKLNSKSGPSNWTEAGVFRVMIDATPPEPVNAAVASDPSVFEGQPFVSFTGVDQTSGISHYEVRFGVGRWQTTNDTVLKVPGLVLGNSVEIKIVDQAGNEEITKIDLNKVRPGPFSNWFFWIIIGIVLLLTVLAALWCRNLLKKYRIK